MFELIRTFVLSDVFLFILILIALATMTRWALSSLKAVRPYILGWMLALLAVVIYSTLQTPEPVTVEAQTTATQQTLYFSDVMVALVFGLLSGGLTVLGLRLGTNARLRTALMVTGYTALIVLLGFMMFISSPHVRRMMTIYLLSFGTLTLFTQVVWTRLPRYTGDYDGDGVPDGDPEVDDMFVAEGEVPMTRSERILAVTRRILNAGEPQVEKTEPVPGEPEAPPRAPELTTPNPIPTPSEPPVPEPVEPPVPRPTPQPAPRPETPPLPNNPPQPAPQPAPPQPRTPPQPGISPERPPNAPPPPPELPPESKRSTHDQRTRGDISAAHRSSTTIPMPRPTVERPALTTRLPLPERVRSRNAKIIHLSAHQTGFNPRGET